jgi:hypothetical protein
MAPSLAVDDRIALDTFLQEMYFLFEEVAVGRWVDPELRDLYTTAWVDGGRFFLEARSRLLPEQMGLPPNLSGPVGEELDPALEEAGLTGVHLQLKIRGYELARDRYRANPSRRLLLRLFKWANVVLGSLAGLVGGAEAIKEMKESLEAGVEEEEV